MDFEIVGLRIKGLNGKRPKTGRSEVGFVQIFYSYSHKDESLRKRLENHLAILQRQGLITGWHDRMIGAGREWKGEIDVALESAQVILLLISPSFVASDYCYDVEMKRALERHEMGQAKVIPVILRPVDWHAAPFGKLQALPRDAKAVTSWRVQDEAFKNVAEGIRGAVEELRERPSAGTTDVGPTAMKRVRPPKSAAAASEKERDEGYPPGTSRSRKPKELVPVWQAARGQVAESSGMWVLLDERFFEAESVDRAYASQ